MPVTLTKIANNTAKVTLRVGEDTVTVTYYPNRITEKTFAELEALGGMNETNIATSFANFNDLLAHLIASWDVYEDDEQTVMFPIAADRLAELPVGFRIQVLQAILGDIRPNTIAPTLLNAS